LTLVALALPNGYHGDFDEHPSYERGADSGTNWARLGEVGCVDLVEAPEVAEVGEMNEA
jgi:hypothetical protein